MTWNGGRSKTIKMVAGLRSAQQLIGARLIPNLKVAVNEKLSVSRGA